MDYKRVLILHYTNGMSSREIAEATGDGKTTINEFLKRFRECEELSYPLSADVTNEFIGDCLYKKAGNLENSDLYRDFNPEDVHRALTRKGETLKHLWKKYNAAGTVNGRKPLSYRQYCRRYTNWLDSTKVTFHIQRIPGVNLELDFAGKTLCIHDRRDPEMTTKVTIFVAALSFSDYFYIEGMTCCDISNWLRVNNNAIAYFGGITQTVTPDNCKVAVTENKDWINPSVNKDFQAWAEHNGTVIMPAKVRKPRWKPNVEGHVKIVTMHILVEMDEMTFYSLDELNAVLWQKMEQENREPFQGLSYSRRDLFESEEKDALLPLPDTQYEYLERKSVKVGPDFSFTFDKVHYSMPRKYLKKTLEIRAGAKKIYVYNEHGDLVRTHERSYTPKSWVVIIWIKEKVAERDVAVTVAHSMQLFISFCQIVSSAAERIERRLSPAFHHINNAFIVLGTQGHDITKGLSQAIEDQVLRPQKAAVRSAFGNKVIKNSVRHAQGIQRLRLLEQAVFPCQGRKHWPRYESPHSARD